MPDENPVPLTIETIAQQLTVLGKRMEDRFAGVEAMIGTAADRVEKLGDRLDAVETKLEDRIGAVEANLRDRIDGVETKLGDEIAAVDTRVSAVEQNLGERINGVETNLRVLIEAVDGKVQTAYEAIVALNEHEAANRNAHRTFEAKIEGHDLRLLALESGRRESARK